MRLVPDPSTIGDDAFSRQVIDRFGLLPNFFCSA